MKISVTMSATIRGRSKPVLDFTTIEAEELFQEEALAKAMETFHICGEIHKPCIFYHVSGKNGVEYGFFLEEKSS